MDYPQGYQQIRVEDATKEKLAFAGPFASKYTYHVMPFRPVNGPMIFVMLAHDMDSSWKEVARTKNIFIDKSTITKLIVDSILSWAISYVIALQYLQCQLIMCGAQKCSLNLKKCNFFPKQMEFIGTDVTNEVNQPAQLKHHFLCIWPLPQMVCDVASFACFYLFHSKLIPNFGIRVAPLQAIMLRPYTNKITNCLDPHIDALSVWQDLKQSILKNPCLAQFDPHKCKYLQTDFSSIGFGYIVLQPRDDQDSLDAMQQEMN